MTPLELVALAPLMDRTTGRPDVIIGLIDGPVMTDHPALAKGVRTIASRDDSGNQCAGAACIHGTFVAGMLCAKRTAPAPAICPDCTLLVRPIFSAGSARGAPVPTAEPAELATAIIECVDAGARCINLSLAIPRPSLSDDGELHAALTYAAQRGAIIVAAAGNQGTLSSNAITRHAWVIPVVACGGTGAPAPDSNLGSSIGRQGLRAPGGPVTSLGAEGKPLALQGTSVAAPFVTGAIALLWSVFANASAAQIKFAVTKGHASARTTVVPPMLNAWRAYQVLAAQMSR